MDTVYYAITPTLKTTSVLSEIFRHKISTLPELMSYTKECNLGDAIAVLRSFQI